MSSQNTPLITPVATPAIKRRDIPAAVAGAVCATLAVGYMVGSLVWRIDPAQVATVGSLGFHVSSLLKSVIDMSGGGFDGYAHRYWLASQQVGLMSLWRVGLTYSLAVTAGIFTYRVLAVEVDPIRHERGRQLKSGTEAATEAGQEAKSETGTAEKGIEVILGSNLRISQDRETKHWIIVGGTGSGKSVAATHILVQVIARNDRLLLIDYKGLTEKCPSNVIIADPTDERRADWDIAADILTVWDAEECAARMIPETKDPFWSSGSRAILTGLMTKCINEKPAKWGFIDLAVLLKLPVEKYAEIIAEHYPQALAFVANAESNTTDSLIKNMSVVCKFIFQLAEAEKQAGIRKKISFRDWIENPNHPDRTIILKINDAFSQLSASYNQAILGVIGSRISTLKDVPAHKNRVWILADEFPKLGAVQGWGALLSVARSKSIRVVTIVQSISQLKEAFGDNETDTWTSIVGSLILGKNSGSTAKWYCDLIGEKEVWTPSNSVSSSAGGFTTTNGYARERLPALLPSQCDTELGLMQGVGCKSIFYGFKNAHILTWRFLSEEDGWFKQREDYEPAQWTLPAKNTGLVIKPTQELHESEIEFEEVEIEQAEHKTEIILVDDAINSIELQTTEPQDDDLAEHVGDAAIEPAIDAAASALVGADIHGIGQILSLTDEIFGGNGDSNQSQITPVTSQIVTKKKQFITRKQMKQQQK
jgi:hypothetical protein